MGRLYTVSFNGVAVTAAQDFFELLMPNDMVGELHRVQIFQSSDSGDAQAEQLRTVIHRVTGSPTSGSGGSTPTPIPLASGDAASTITAEANNTTALSGGTSTILHTEAWNVMAGMDYFPPPEHRPRVAPSTRLVINLPSAPADSLTMSATVTIAEID